MIFRRSVPPRRYRDYTKYRSLLRNDFRYRCAYCLMHEFYLGGEAGLCVEHHRPVKGRYARPDLIAEYTNLYWCCRECNENKSDTWPPLDDYQAGVRFLDPCQIEDDHDLHWRILPDGGLEPLTLTGEYTIDVLKLWRASLRYHRAKQYRLQEEADTLERLLAVKELSGEQRHAVEGHLRTIREWLEPPVFDRPRGADDNGE